MIKNHYEHTPKGGKVEQIIILLHGLGSNGRDLISLAPYWAEKLPQALFISPDAPFACDMAPPNYPDCFQWFSLQDRSTENQIKGLKVIFPILNDFVEAQLERFGLSHKALAFAGFSQGAMTSLHIAPRLKAKPAGVLAYSGRLVETPESITEIKHRPPVHLIHGDADDVVPVGNWNHAHDMLKQHGFDVSGHITPNLTHSIDMDGIRSGGEFLCKIFA